MIEKKGEFVKYYSWISIDLASSLMQIQGNEKSSASCVDLMYTEAAVQACHLISDLGQSSGI